ncbi:hypothetical protein AWZ03_006683 [Drosophila navojoa]|uniref:Uncharacterized protein n=1 Tax=Drosophila navojoa TaxID=7232 RepID=A0A484BDL1_DRONA|nr:hypothetical protein AWZ03_006683 [Drosophila navojoa]
MLRMLYFIRDALPSKLRSLSPSPSPSPLLREFASDRVSQRSHRVVRLERAALTSRHAQHCFGLHHHR